MQEYRKPPCRIDRSNKIGSGGNGDVYLSSDPEYVCKIFSVDGDLAPEKKEERYKRFCQEIHIQKELSKTLKGVLPIKDYFCPQNYDDDSPAWFTMPKAEKFTVKYHRDIADKIKDLIELGNIIKEIHSRGIAHRDIKPENILIYKKQIVLSDFGLVWVEGENTLTILPERIGPIKILSPELETCEDISKCDYKKSDVYLFSKVAWMYIKEDRYGFKGPYNRGAGQIFLEREKYNCTCLEPFHLMMEYATKEKWQERNEIADCLEYLRIQLAIVCNEINEEELKKYLIQEKTSCFEAIITPNYKVYSDPDKIAALLDALIPETCFEFRYGLDFYIIRPKKYKFLSDGVIMLIEELPDRKNKHWILNICEVEIHEKEIVFNTVPLAKEEFEKYKKEQYRIINIATKVVITKISIGKNSIARQSLTIIHQEGNID